MSTDGEAKQARRIDIAIGERFLRTGTGGNKDSIILLFFCDHAAAMFVERIDYPDPHSPKINSRTKLNRRVWLTGQWKLNVNSIHSSLRQSTS